MLTVALVTTAAERDTSPTAGWQTDGRAAEDTPWALGAETRIQLLGRFRVWVRHTAIPDEAWTLRKARTLVKLLALAPNYRVHREQLIDQLWPGLSPRSASHNLSVTLHAALQALGHGPADPHRLLARVGDELVLGHASPTLTDVEAFEAAALAARTADEPAAYHDALDLYVGDLLPEDRYDDEFAVRRHRLRSSYHEVLDGLIRLYESRGDYAAALVVAGAALARDPAGRDGEALYVAEMRLHALAGRRDLAERRYVSLAAMLRREMDTEPGDEAQTLHREIGAGRFGTPSPRPLVPRHEDSDHIPPRHIPPFFVRAEWFGRYGKRPGEFDRPHSVAVDAAGNAYVTDQLNHRVQVLDHSGGFVREWGTSGAGPRQFNRPLGIAVAPDGTVYVVDYGNHRMQRFLPDGTLVRAWGTFGGGPGAFDFPYGVAVDPQGSIYVTERHGARVQKFTATGDHILTWGEHGSAPGQFDSPMWVTTDRAGCVYVADTNNHRIQKFTGDGVLVTHWGRYGTADGEFRYPFGVTVDSAGDLYVADGHNMRIQKFSADGRFLCKWGRYGHEPGEFDGPRGLATDAGGTLYVVEAGNNWIQRFVAGPQLVMRALP